jgi:hypothetical protein
MRTGARPPQWYEERPFACRLASLPLRSLDFQLDSFSFSPDDAPNFFSNLPLREV